MSGTETGSSAFSAVSSPRPESAPPQLGGDGFCCLTFGNDPGDSSDSDGKRKNARGDKKTSDKIMVGDELEGEE